jgi:hypothetical protein
MASVRRTLPELQQGTVDDCSELHHNSGQVHCVCLFDHGIRFRMNSVPMEQRNMLF